MFLLLFIIFTNLYLSFNTILLKLSFSHASGKILGDPNPPKLKPLNNLGGGGARPPTDRLCW